MFCFLPEPTTIAAETLRRMFAGKVVVTSSVERAAMIELVGQNRFLLDISLDEPLLSVFCDCRWIS